MMPFAFDAAAFRQWLLTRRDTVAGYTFEMQAHPLALWCSESAGEVCSVWSESYCFGVGLWMQMPAWAVAFAQTLEQTAGVLVAVTGQEALAVLDALASSYPECAAQEERMTLREALHFGHGAVTADGKSYVRYHEDYHIDFDSPWVYWPDLSEKEMWILPEEELENRIQRSREACWIIADNLIW